MSLQGTMRSTRTTFGVRLPTSGPLATVEAVLKSVEVLESLGYDSLWTNDHISWIPESLTHFSAGAMEAVADQDVASVLRVKCDAVQQRKDLDVAVALVVDTH